MAAGGPMAGVWLTSRVCVRAVAGAAPGQGRTALGGMAAGDAAEARGSTQARAAAAAAEPGGPAEHGRAGQRLPRRL